jgi:hypothetical protein
MKKTPKLFHIPKLNSTVNLEPTKYGQGRKYCLTSLSADSTNSLMNVAPSAFVKSQTSMTAEIKPGL